MNGKSGSYNDQDSLGDQNLRALGRRAAGFELSSFVTKWRATADEDGHYSFAVAL
jgi:hypothetical protein